ncbi:hypothetical protein SAY86_005770 [Trapa natans]|uniref:Uncharacterized protein n=1 Tax=Trapa natans TaxID=22666 RepID=A0AAN7L9W9_TRANT|nr:hypothetical protein SAY86_005770 [Trapa natans]
MVLRWRRCSAVAVSEEEVSEEVTGINREGCRMMRHRDLSSRSTGAREATGDGPAVEDVFSSGNVGGGGVFRRSDRDKRQMEGCRVMRHRDLSSREDGGRRTRMREGERESRGRQLGEKIGNG